MREGEGTEKVKVKRRGKETEKVKERKEETTKEQKTVYKRTN